MKRQALCYTQPTRFNMANKFRTGLIYTKNSKSLIEKYTKAVMGRLTEEKTRMEVRETQTESTEPWSATANAGVLAMWTHGCACVVAEPHIGHRRDKGLRFLLGLVLHTHDPPVHSPRRGPGGQDAGGPLRDRAGQARGWT